MMVSTKSTLESDESIVCWKLKDGITHELWDIGKMIKTVHLHGVNLSMELMELLHHHLDMSMTIFTSTPVIFAGKI